MGKSKKYLIKTVNLGEVGHPARLLSEEYLKRYGKQEFSSLIRKLITIFLSNNPEFDNWKKMALLHERDELKKQIPEISDKLCKNAEKLEKMGVNTDEL